MWVLYGVVGQLDGEDYVLGCERTIQPAISVTFFSASPYVTLQRCRLRTGSMALYMKARMNQEVN